MTPKTLHRQAVSNDLLVGAAAWRTNLRQRVITALILIPVVLTLVWFGGWAVFAGATLVLLQGARELHAMFALRGWHPLTALSSVIGVDFLLAAMLPEQSLVVLAIGLSALVVGPLIWLLATRPMGECTIIEWALTIAISIYLGWPLSLILLLRGGDVGIAVPGFWWLLLLLLAVWANDSAALFTGRSLGGVGRHRLAPGVSPGKTWEGVCGGLVGSILAVAAVAAIASLASHLLVPWYHWPILGALITVAATLGDLAKSVLKRGVGVKDSGSILPGHGGILDRADSTLFASILVFFYAYALAFVALR
jgi:phosphatidate cytidylyltransferase